MEYLRLLCFFCIVTINIGNMVHAECPDFWVTYEGSCYLFTHSNLHFTEAEHFCTQHKSHLVHIDSALENNFVKSFAMDLKNADFWIGLTDTITEGVWQWIDTGEVTQFTDWYPGEPNNGKAGDCAHLWADQGFRWADGYCTSDRHTICEKPVITVEIVG